MLTIYNEHRETLINFLWRSLQIFGKQGITFLIFLMSVRMLSPYEFGTYSYVLTIVLLLGIFSDFGISTAASKYVTEYNNQKSASLNRVLFNSLIIVLVIASALSVFIILFGEFYFAENFKNLLILLPLIFLIPATALFDGIYRGKKQFKILTVVTLISGFISVPVVYFLILKYGVVGALVSQNFFFLILCLSLAAGHKDYSFKFDVKVMKDVGVYSFVYGIAIIGNYLFIKFGILILGHYNYIEEIATYELINRIFMILVIPFTLLGQVVAPNFTLLALRGDTNLIYKKALKYTSIFLSLSLILFIVLYLLMPLFFKYFFYNYYIKDYFNSTLIICLIIYCTNVASATFDAGILVPSGNAQLMAKVYTVGGIIGVILSLIAVKYLQYFGVILTFAVCNLVFIIVLRILFLAKLRIN